MRNDRKERAYTAETNTSVQTCAGTAQTQTGQGRRGQAWTPTQVCT